MGERAIGQGRVVSLDGLRGAAALVVVLHHCMLVSPALMAAFRRQGDLAPWSWQWWALRTPLHLLWSGDEAVVIFFVLSGVVLTLPAIDTQPRWSAYYLKRLLRLYVPVWASLVVALAVLTFVATPPRPGQSTWLLERTTPVGIGYALRDATLAGPSPTVNGILWSLHYELLFSLLLPAYLVFAKCGRRWWPVKIAGAVAASALGTVLDVPALELMPVFAVGAVLAVERDRLASLAGAVRCWQWVVLLAGSGFLLIGRWIGIPGHIATATTAAAVLVLAVQHHDPTRRVASSRTLQWLGKCSFSLYLVHEPIVVAVATSTAATSPLLPLVLATPMALFVAAVFYRLVEKPSQRLAVVAARPLTRAGTDQSASAGEGCDTSTKSQSPRSPRRTDT